MSRIIFVLISLFASLGFSYLFVQEITTDANTLSAVLYFFASMSLFVNATNNKTS